MIALVTVGILRLSGSLTPEHEAKLRECRTKVIDFNRPVHPCDRVKYDEILYQMESSNAWMLEKDHTTSTGVIPRLTSISFKDFFFQHALREVSVIIDGENLANITGRLQDVNDTFSSLAPIVQCAKVEAKSDVMRASLPKTCPSTIRSSASVPKFVLNDYTMRLSEAVAPSLIGLKRYPEVVLTKVGARQKLHNCPHHSHMILALLHGELTVTVFAKNQTHFLRRQGRTVNQNSQADTITGTLQAGELLFVPGGAFLSWQTSAATQAVMLQHCYIDASNFRNVKEELKLQALIDVQSRLAYQLFNSVAFPTEMSQTPEDSPGTWQYYTAWPREDDKPSVRSRKSKSKKKNKDAFRKWQDTKKWNWQVLRLTLPPPTAPRVLAIGRNNVTVQWTSPMVRHESDDTAFGYRVEWQEENAHGRLIGPMYHIDFNDSDVERVSTESENAELIVSLTSTDSQILAPNTTYSFTVAIFMGSDMHTTSPSDRSLPITTTCITVASPVPAAPSILLAKDSPTITPHSLALQWPKPFDHGGSPILNYEIQLRKAHGRIKHSLFQPLDGVATFANEHFDIELTVDGEQHVTGVMTATVSNLVPNTTYECRIASVNLIGMSEWSMINTSLTTAPPAQKWDRTTSKHSFGHVHLFGLGHPNLQFHHKHFVPGKKGLLIRLSDTKQQIFISPVFKDPFSAHVWANHHSPQHHDVTAELVVAKPFTASSPLANAAEVRHRIVLIERGEVPLLVKARHAQDAGALGVVIADLEGTCLDFDQSCVPGAAKNRGEGMAVTDAEHLWSAIVIPSVLLLKKDSERLLRLVEEEAGLAIPPTHTLVANNDQSWLFVDKSERNKSKAHTSVEGEDHRLVQVEVSATGEVATSAAEVVAGDRAADGTGEVATSAAEVVAGDRAADETGEVATSAAEVVAGDRAADGTGEVATSAAEVVAGDRAADGTGEVATSAAEVVAGDRAADETGEVATSAAEVVAGDRAADGTGEVATSAAEVVAGDRAADGTGEVDLARYKDGDRVEAHYKGSVSWYSGKIVGMNGDASYRVLFDDGDSDDEVPHGSIRPAA